MTFVPVARGRRSKPVGRWCDRYLLAKGTKLKAEGRTVGVLETDCTPRVATVGVVWRF